MWRPAFATFAGLFMLVAVPLHARRHGESRKEMVSTQRLRRGDERLRGNQQAEERRQLQATTTAYSVTLHLALLYLNETVASELETREPTNSLVLHFCDSVNHQVRMSVTDRTNRKGRRAHRPYSLLLHRQVEAKSDLLPVS